METKLIYRYLQRLHVADWEGFALFLSSSWTGKSKTYLRYLKEFRAMRFDGRVHSMESFYAVVHPGRDYDGNHLTQQLSRMLDRLFSFLAWDEFKADATAQKGFLMRSLARREWGDAFEKEGRRSDTFSGAIRDSSRLLDAAQLELLKIDIGLGSPPKSAAPPFAAAIDALEEAYTVTSLDLACKALNVDLFPQKGSRRQIPKHRLPGWMERPMQNALPSDGLLTQILRSIYQMYSTSAAASPEAYQVAKRLLMEAIGHRHAHNAAMFLDLFTHLVNFAARRLQDGDAGYLDELLDIYHFMLQHHVIVLNTGLHSLHLQNIITTFFQAKKLDWVEAFLQQYMPMLKGEETTTVGTYNLALLHFYQGKYHESRSLLREVGQASAAYRDAEFLLIFNAYVMVMDYACGDFAQIESRSKNYDRWIRSVDTLRLGRKQRYLQFSKFVKKMAQLAENRSAIDVRIPAMALRVQLDRKGKNAPVLVGWLREQLDLLVDA